MARLSATLIILLACIATSVEAFYLPGVAPKAYNKGERLLIKVQSLTSDESSLTFDYYQLPYCHPPEDVEYSENLGEALLGEKSFLSPYVATVLNDSNCNVACMKKLTLKEVEEFQDFIILGFNVNMRADNLPLAHVIPIDEANNEYTYRLGHPVGEAGTDGDVLYLNNHLDFTIKYHPVEKDDVVVSEVEDLTPKGGYYIVGFQVEPRSILHDASHYKDCKVGCELSTCGPMHVTGDVTKQDLPLEKGDTVDVLFTYSVRWEQSDVKWASRWDIFLKVNKDNIHWFSVVNSIVVLVFLTGIIAMIMARILKKDFAMYNEMSQIDDEEGNKELRDETGWKLVYGDVFRSPNHPLLLTVFLGTGAQIFCMLIATLVFAVLGFLSPANRGALVTYILIFYVLMGAVAGHVSARFCKTFKEPNQFRCTLLTGILLPAIVFGVFLVINIFLWSQAASDAVPFGTMIALMALWFGISLPLVFFGGYIGFKRDAYDLPVRVNTIPRQIPPTAWYLQTAPSVLLAGILPFGVMFVELTVILNSLWHHRFYYLFGFLFLVFAILVVTIAEITIVLCYLQLCSEDYRWWWRAFLAGGSVAGYLFAYSTYYYLRHVHLVGLGGMISGIVHIGYTAVLSLCIWVFCGFIGCVACFWFCRIIYSAVKVD